MKTTDATKSETLIHVFLIALVFAVLASLAGCAADQPPATPQPAADLVGTWVAHDGDATTTLVITCGDITVVAHVDGQADQTLEGGYDASHGTVTLTQGDSVLVLGYYRIDGDVMTIIDGNTLTIIDGIDGTYRRTGQALACGAGQ